MGFCCSNNITNQMCFFIKVKMFIQTLEYNLSWSIQFIPITMMYLTRAEVTYTVSIVKPPIVYQRVSTKYSLLQGTIEWEQT